MNNTVDLVTEALERFWSLKVLSLDSLSEEEHRRRYRARTKGRVVFVKVDEDGGETYIDLDHGYRLQSYLAHNGFPANQPLMTRDGDFVKRLSGCVVGVEPWIEPVPFEMDSEHWRAFGRAVGHLHSLPIPEALKSRLSRMDPNRDLDGVLQRIRERTADLPNDKSGKVRRFLDMAGGLDVLKQIPRAMIHSDLAWGNIMQSPEGKLILVDWEGGGVGPPIVDLVEVTTYLRRSEPGSLHEGAAAEFYRGYREHRSLTPSELESIEQAHLYHQLYYLADSLTRGDFGFVDRMSARMAGWYAGTLDRLVEIAAS